MKKCWNKIILYMFLLFIQGTMFAQTNEVDPKEQKKIDSLENVLKKATDIEKISTLNELAETYRGIDNIKSKNYAINAAALAENSNNKKELVRSYRALANLYLEDTASTAKLTCIDFAMKALKIAKENNFTDIEYKIYSTLTYAYNDSLQLVYSHKALQGAIQNKDLITETNHLQHIAMYYYFKGKLDSTIKYWSNEIEVFKSLKDSSMIAQYTMNVGTVYQQMAIYDKAIESFQTALKMFEEIGNIQKAAMNYYNIGNVYFAFGNNIDKAIEYYTKAEIKFNESKDNLGLTYVKNSIGLVYQKKEKFKEALDYFKQADKLSETIEGEYYLKGNIQGNIGNIYAEEKDYVKAIYYCKRSIESNRLSENNAQIALAKKNLGDVYNTWEKYDLALENFLECLVLFKEMKMIKEESDLNKDIAEVYTKLNDYKNAYDYYQKYSNLKDTIFKEDSQRAITEMATKYETDKKDKENQLLAAGNKIKDSELQRAKVISYFIIFVAVFILLLAFLSYNRYLIKKKANEELAMRNAQIMQQKEEIQAQRDEIEQQRDVVVKQKQEITDSIIYAQRIQKAILPPKELLDEALPNHFIHYKPRDIVSGDFYWMTQKDGRVVITAADCTGHGVPGAFMSMLGVSFLNEIANKPEIQHAHEILNQLRDYVMNSLRQTGKDNEAKDGMDISLSIIDYSNMKLEFAGAYNPLYLIRNNEILELKADKMPIGIYYKGQKSFEVTEMEIQTGDVIYMFSDGYADQFGGDKGRKFMTKNFKELLLQIHLKPMEEQRELLNTTMEKWRGPIHQIDDMLVIGIRI